MLFFHGKHRAGARVWCEINSRAILRCLSVYDKHSCLSATRKHAGGFPDFSGTHDAAPIFCAGSARTLHLATLEEHVLSVKSAAVRRERLPVCGCSLAQPLPALSSRVPGLMRTGRGPACLRLRPPLSKNGGARYLLLGTLDRFVSTACFVFSSAFASREICECAHLSSGGPERK